MIILGFFLISAPALFLEQEAAVGICSAAGWFFFLAAERSACTKKQLALTVLLFTASFVIRYCRTFSIEPVYFVLSLAVLFLIGLLNALLFVFDHLLIRENHRILAVLAVPGGYALIQYLLLAAGAGNYFDLLGYVTLLPVYCMNLSQIGEYGLITVAALILSLAADTVSRSRKNRNIAGVVLGLLLAAVFTGTGEMLLNTEKEPDAVLEVALGLPFENDAAGSKTEDHSAEEWKELFERTVRTAAENGADLLVLTEEFYPMRASREEEIMEAVSEIVKENGIPVLACFDIGGEETEKAVNKAVFYDGQGNVRMEYLKNNLIPVLESGKYVDGPEEPGVCTMEIGGREIKTATVICFDHNDAEYIHKVPQDTELLLVPAWEWNTTSLEQPRQRNRSVELQTTVLKHSFDGFSYASGPWGLYGEMLDNRGVYDTVRMIEVPVWEKQPAG